VLEHRISNSLTVSCSLVQALTLLGKSEGMQRAKDLAAHHAIAAAEMVSHSHSLPAWLPLQACILLGQPCGHHCHLVNCCLIRITGVRTRVACFGLFVLWAVWMPAQRRRSVHSAV
jgi:hypothetical protein